MKKTLNRTHVQQPRRPWAVYSLVTILAVVVLALSVVSVLDSGTEEHPGLPVRSAPLSTEPAPPLDAAPPAPPVPPVQPTLHMAQQRMLSVDGDQVVRAIGGSCDTPGRVEFSQDDGFTWNASLSLAGTGATQILRLVTADLWRAQVVAMDANCLPQVYQTSDFGMTWNGPSAVAGMWFLNPADPVHVVTPTGVQPLPCAAVEISAVEDRAAIRCNDGAVHTTLDQGRTWNVSPTVGPAAALSTFEGAYAAAVTGDATCAGLRLVTIGASSSGPSGCFETLDAVSAAEQGQVAVVHEDGLTILWVDDQFVISDDGGMTWS